MNLDRRSIFRLVGLVATTVTGPGRALGKVTLAATAGMSALGNPTGGPETGSAPESGFSPSPKRQAIQYLESFIYGSRRRTPLLVTEIRADIACLRSASPSSRERWERQARLAEADQIDDVSAAIALLAKQPGD